MPHAGDHEARERDRALRSAWAMAAGGAALLLCSLVIGDQRWRGVVLIAGALLGGVGVLTLVWRSVEESLPRWRGD